MEHAHRGGNAEAAHRSHAGPQIVWEFTADDAPELNLTWVSSIRIPKNGDYLVGNFLRGQEGKGAHAFEVTRDKKVVWTFADHKQFRSVTTVRAVDSIDPSKIESDSPNPCLIRPRKRATPGRSCSLRSSSGIGQACATISCRARLAGVWNAVRLFQLGTGAPFEMITMDVDDDASVQAGVAAVLERAGRLDAVVNNAGISLMGPIEDTSTEEAKVQMETNFFGVLRVCRATLPALRRTGRRPHHQYQLAGGRRRTSF